MRKLIVGMLCASFMLGLGACSTSSQGEATTSADGTTYSERLLSLCVGDTYDFAQMGYIVDSLQGTALYAIGDCITAMNQGDDVVIVSDSITLEQYRYTVTVYSDATTLGGRFPVDRGLFAGKKVIAFGDSITDGCLLDPNTVDGFNYNDTFFAQLCRYLRVASDPTDLENCNFACGGTMLTYGPNGYGISGVQRVSQTEPFTDAGRIRNPYPNIQAADLCILFYGTNDLTKGVAARASEKDALTDEPRKMEDAKTICGGMYYMIQTLHEINPNLKILVLPPLYRRADGHVLKYSDDLTDVINQSTDATLLEYREVIEEVCAKQGAKFVDWYSLFNFENFGRTDVSVYSYDGLHPNVAGHQQMFEYLVEQLEKSNK